MEEKNLGGRPPKWSDPDTLERAIQEYFDGITRDAEVKESVQVGTDINGKPVYENKPVIGRNGKPVMTVEYVIKPTITGLARHLGVDRRTLVNYTHNDGFCPLIKEAKAKIEAYLENRLDERAAVVGTIFTLKNNYGWRDQSETVVTTGSHGSDEYDFAALPPDELATLMRLLDKAKRSPITSDE